MSLNCEDLYKWIDDHPLSRQKRNINRDFSDAIPLAEILKHHYPKLVDMHNYTPKNAFVDKLINWRTLNKKVLNKLKLNLTEATMEKLSKCEQGVIEKVLFDIKTIIETKAAGDEESRRSRSTQNIVPAEVLEKLETDIVEKEDAIHTLKKKVDHLENLLKVKEDRIKELTKKVDSFTARANKSFFQKFF